MILCVSNDIGCVATSISMFVNTKHAMIYDYFVALDCDIDKGIIIFGDYIENLDNIFIYPGII